MTFLFLSNVIQAQHIEITLLGTGGPPPNIERFGPSTVIQVDERYFVFDAGRGATIRLQQAGIPLDKIERVFLTHLHSDHISGLADLWLTSWIWQRANRLNVFGPIGTQDFIEHLQQAYSEDIKLRGLNANLDTNLSKIKVQQSDLENFIAYDENGVKITAFRVSHGVVKQAYGYKLESQGRKIILSGDTTYSENLVNQAQNADVLIHEIVAVSPALLERNKRLQKIVSYHSTPESLIQVFTTIKPKLTILNHILLFGVSEKQVLAKLKTSNDQKIFFGNDLLKISIGKSIVMIPPN